MSIKPTYKDLERRVRELEKKEPTDAGRGGVEGTTKMRAIFDQTYQFMVS